MFQRCLWLFLCSGIAVAQSAAPPPDAAEQARIVAAFRQYAAAFQMPDVAFDAAVTESTAPSGSQEWKKTFSVYTSRYVHAGREYWRPMRKNGQPVPRARWRPRRALYDDNPMRASNALTLLTSGGQDNAASTLLWDHWETVAGHRFAVFNYKIAQADSKLVLAMFKPGEARDEPAPANAKSIPYSGAIYVDPGTGAIWRYTELATDIPAGYKAFGLFGVCDYAEVTVGANQYLLPVDKEIITTYVGIGYRDEFKFGNYRKLDGRSSLALARKR